MFRQILFTQWKWTRLTLLIAVVAAFAIPLLSVTGDAQYGDGALEARELLGRMQLFGIWYAVLAAALGLFLGTTAWAPDHRGRHVYALSLPIARWRYALYRLGAGALLLLAPALALWLGALGATHMIAIPAGLEGYPTALALRFLLATLVAYAIVFAVAAGTARTAGYVLGAIGVVLALTLVLPSSSNGALFDVISRSFFSAPGVLGVFTGRWMLVDV